MVASFGISARAMHHFGGFRSADENLRALYIIVRSVENAYPAPLTCIMPQQIDRVDDMLLRDMQLISAHARAHPALSS